jgi:LacI family gluconate utilization system Gnt-I transcriptional repressor
MAAPSSIEAGRDGLERILARMPALEAVYFSNDDMAIGGYFLCLSRGIAIPGRLALFGYNGLDVARLAPQPLATIRTPRVLVGQTAARLALSGEPAQVVDVGFELVEGATA